MLPNFGHMTTSIAWFESRDKTFYDAMGRNSNAITFILKYLYFQVRDL